MARSKTSTASVLAAGATDPVDVEAIKNRLIEGMEACGGYSATSFIRVGPTDVVVDKLTQRVYVGSDVWEVLKSIPQK